MFQRFFHQVTIELQIGFCEYQYRLYIFFQYLKHKALGSANAEIRIKALYNKCLVDMGRYSLPVRCCSALFPVQCMFTRQNIDDYSIVIVKRLKNNPIARAREFK
jgi:hypothetical protein